jgi:hypothetical protein
MLELTILGSLLSAAGTYLLARNFIISKEKAIDVGVMRVSGVRPEENLKLPAVQDRLRQRRDAVIGLPLAVGGIIILAIASLV